MEFITLTSSTIPIIGQVAWVLGKIMDLIFNVVARFDGTDHVANIGLCIIIFTIIINLLMLPLTIKQQKSSKIMAVMQPEIQAIQKKYKGKQDNATMAKQNAEIQAVYEKYGTSMMGGCGNLVIQMPILFALYQVIYKIPAYVSSVKTTFENIALPILQADGTGAKLTEFLANASPKISMAASSDFTNKDIIIDFLYKLDPSQWSSLSEKLASPAVTEAIGVNLPLINKMNNFLGISLATSPWTVIKGYFSPVAGAEVHSGYTIFVVVVAVLIPILAGLTQYFSAKLMTVNQPQGDPDSAMAQQMKTMNMTMPLVSLVMCFSFASGIGIYWIASAVCRILQQLFINAHLKNIDIDQLVAQNIEKANKKREKKGLPPVKTGKQAIASAKSYEAKAAKEEQEMETKISRAAKQVQDSSAYYNRNAKPGSLASKANMVAMFDERKEAQKRGKKDVDDSSTQEDDK